MPECTLLHGDCRATLATLPAASVQTCITSPPYFGLRSYATAPQVWGGRDDCAHSWVWATRKGQSGGTASAKVRVKDQANFQIVPDSEYATCATCGAWRGESGAEPTIEQYVANLVTVFRAVRRVLRPDGTLWLNLGDSYTNAGQSGTNRGARGAKPAYTPVGTLGEKQLLGVPWRVAFALQADGWVLRSDIIWAKSNAMPESVTDRPTKAHEYLFLLAPGPRYYYDAAAIAEPTTIIDTRQLDRDRINRGDDIRGRKQRCGGAEDGTRNKRTVWNVATRPYKGAHFATFPPDLIRPCVLAGSRPGDTVLDPFNGAGTTGVVALEAGRAYIGCELNADYLALTQARLATVQPVMQEVA